MFRDQLRKLFEGNIFEAPEAELEPLSFGDFDISDQSQDTIIGDEPQQKEEPKDLKILKTHGVPKGKGPIRFMGVPVNYDQSTPDAYKKAMQDRQMINRFYSAVKDSIENFYAKRMPVKVDPNSIDVETGNDDDGVPFRDAFINNFRVMKGYKDTGATIQDALIDLVSINFDEILNDRRKNPSMTKLKVWLDKLGIDDNTFRETLAKDMAERLMKTSNSAIVDFRDRFERSKASQQRGAETNIVKKARHKTEAAAKQLNDMVYNAPVDVKSHYEYERFRDFSGRIQDKIKKIDSQYKNKKKRQSFDAAAQKFDTLTARIQDNIKMLQKLMGS